MNFNKEFILALYSIILLIQNGESRILGYRNSTEASEDKLIVGGTQAKRGQFGYQVGLMKKSSSGALRLFCGGSIIGKNVVLTAAHCMGTPADKFVIYHGGLSTLNLNPGQKNVKSVKSTLVHEKYDKDSMKNDIALIFTKEDFVFDENTQSVAIATQKLALESILMTIITGWGTTSEGGEVSSDLLYAEVPVISNKECQKAYGESKIFDSNICAGLSEGGKDTCQGDSGGPLCIKMDGETYVAGITSWGKGCARKDYPGVYTRVSSFEGWINAHKIQ